MLSTHVDVALLKNASRHVPAILSAAAQSRAKNHSSSNTAMLATTE